MPQILDRIPRLTMGAGALDGLGQLVAGRIGTPWV